ncbi:MAG: ABC-2 family transporter protein [Planctomycetes bacterium]|nr:ABC-2 family transporter protein [Planctomycetota bacterium]
MQETSPITDAREVRPSYWGVFRTFLRNSLVRAMMFRGNFLLDTFTSLTWMAMQLGFYKLVFQFTPSIGNQTGWGEYEFYTFIATSLIINSLVQTFFMPNLSEFSDLIRTGNLDFALLKPIDTQFLVSLQKVEWSALGNFLFGVALLGWSVVQLDVPLGPAQWLLYPIYVLCGVAIFYAVMVLMSSLSVWMGRNENLYDFWFYITNFSRYPMEIYRGPVGEPLRWTFTFVVPILVVVNVPARALAWPLERQQSWLAAYAVGIAVVSLLVTRRLFLWALNSYRSASS